MQHSVGSILNQVRSVVIGDNLDVRRQNFIVELIDSCFNGINYLGRVFAFAHYQNTFHCVSIINDVAFPIFAGYRIATAHPTQAW